MNPTKNDLSPGKREKLAQLLNVHLAQAVDLALQAKQAHWNVKGPNFIALHELFDKVSDAAREWADELAERAVALGGNAEGSLSVVAQRTKLPAYTLSTADGAAHVNALSDGLAAFAKGVRAAIQGLENSDEVSDPATEDLLTGIVREADKQLWFLEAHLHAAAR